MYDFWPRMHLIYITFLRGASSTWIGCPQLSAYLIVCCERDAQMQLQTCFSYTLVRNGMIFMNGKLAIGVGFPGSPLSAQVALEKITEFHEIFPTWNPRDWHRKPQKYNPSLPGSPTRSGRRMVDQSQRLYLTIAGRHMNCSSLQRQ